MNSTDIAPMTKRAPVATQQTNRKPRELKPTRKIAECISYMVYEGLTRKQAADKAGITEHGLYVAFRKPHVKAAYLRELEVLRTSEMARNFHALIDVREQTDNQQARVNAVKAMREMDAISPLKSAAPTPGVVIVIAGENAKAAVQVNSAPPMTDESE